MDLTAPLSTALATVAAQRSARAGRQARPAAGRVGQQTLAAPTATASQVFQMADIPQPLDPARFAGARSNADPNGSFVTLRALRDLVDPVPLLARTYQPSGESTEQAWGGLLAGATADPESPYAQQALAAAQAAFENARLAPLDGMPGSWRPVYASPSGWAEAGTTEAFRPVTVDLSGRSTGGTGTEYATVGTGGGSATLQWRVDDGSSKGPALRPLDSFSSLQSLTFDVLEVTLHRPWLDAGLLRAGGVRLPGQPEGLYSTGSLDGNDGILPLLPTSFWYAKNVQLQGDLAKKDKSLLAATKGKARVSLGGIAVDAAAASGPAAGSGGYQVIAWTSVLVPRWPAS